MPERQKSHQPCIMDIPLLSSKVLCLCLSPFHANSKLPRSAPPSTFHTPHSTLHRLTESYGVNVHFWRVFPKFIALFFFIFFCIFLLFFFFSETRAAYVSPTPPNSVNAQRMPFAFLFSSSFIHHHL